MSEYLESIKNYRFLRDKHPRIFKLIEQIWDGAREEKEDESGYDNMNISKYSGIEDFLKNEEIFKEILIMFNLKED